MVTSKADAIWWMKLREAIFARDRQCFYSREDPIHVCRDAYGKQHSPFDTYKLTLDHVHLVAGGVRGRRAPNDLRHMTAMCAESNIKGPPSWIREKQREYLVGIYGNEEESGGS